MSEVDLIEVSKREKFGKLNNRRMRSRGMLPAVLYGHGEETVSLTIPADQFEASLRHGAKVIRLQGAAKGQALLQDVQWDVFHQQVLHVDLLRVSAKERVVVEVPVALRGVAPGDREGGVTEQLLHTVEVEASPANIPEQLQVNVNDLHLHGSIKVSEIEDLPEGVKLITDLDAPLVQCVEPEIVPEVEEGIAVEGAEPEVIRREEEEEDTEEGSAPE